MPRPVSRRNTVSSEKVRTNAPTSSDAAPPPPHPTRYYSRFQAGCIRIEGQDSSVFRWIVLIFVHNNHDYLLHIVPFPYGGHTLAPSKMHMSMCSFSVLNRLNQDDKNDTQRWRLIKDGMDIVYTILEGGNLSRALDKRNGKIPKGIRELVKEALHSQGQHWHQSFFPDQQEYKFTALQVAFTELRELGVPLSEQVLTERQGVLDIPRIIEAYWKLALLYIQKPQTASLRYLSGRIVKLLNIVDGEHIDRFLNIHFSPHFAYVGEEIWSRECKCCVKDLEFEHLQGLKSRYHLHPPSSDNDSNTHDDNDRRPAPKSKPSTMNDHHHGSP